MKLIASIILILSSTIGWHNNFDEAKQIAQKEHKHILLNFSGSDWCGPCIRLHTEVFTKDEFKQIADKNLVLVNADFPRNRKNQLSAAQQKINESLADKYNPQGIFPYTVLLNENGKVVKAWDGFPRSSILDFIDEIQATIEADK